MWVFSNDHDVGDGVFAGTVEPGGAIPPSTFAAKPCVRTMPPPPLSIYFKMHFGSADSGSGLDGYGPRCEALKWCTGDF